MAAIEMKARAATRMVQTFLMEETVEGPGVVRLALVGELDLATSDAFSSRLSQLQSREEDVRLDLSRLEFIDARGIGVLVRAVQEARERHWQLQVERGVAPHVSRLLALVGADVY